MTPEAHAVASLGDGDPRWYGFGRTDAGEDLLMAGGDDTRLRPGTADELVALAIAYFAGLPEPPDGLAATHEDVAGLVARLAATEVDPGRRRMLDDARDAIDDGLAAEVVMASLTAALSPAAALDPVSFAVANAKRLLGDD